MKNKLLIFYTSLISLASATALLSSCGMPGHEHGQNAQVEWDAIVTELVSHTYNPDNPLLSTGMSLSPNPHQVDLFYDQKESITTWSKGFELLMNNETHYNKKDMLVENFTKAFGDNFPTLSFDTTTPPTTYVVGATYASLTTGVHFIATSTKDDGLVTKSTQLIYFSFKVVSLE